eukprot:3320809-Rhodomonas_salina.1
MGMGNNPIFRVKVHACPSESSPQGLSIWFEHPTVAGPAAGGWMVKPSVDFPTGTKAYWCGRVVLTARTGDGAVPWARVGTSERVGGTDGAYDGTRRRP